MDKLLLLFCMILLFPNNGIATGSQDTIAQISKEEANKNLIVYLLAPYTTKSIKNHYGENIPWQLEQGQITDTKMIYTKKGLVFIVKLKVQPFVGAHDPLGTDLFTFKIKDMKITLEKFEHLESFPIRPYLKQYYPNLKTSY